MDIVDLVTHAFAEIDAQMCRQINEYNSTLLKETDIALNNILQNIVLNNNKMEQSMRCFTADAKAYVISLVASTETKDKPSTSSQDVKDTESFELNLKTEDKEKEEEVIGHMIETYSPKMQDKGNKEVYQCNECSDIFSRKRDLVIHIKRIHLKLKDQKCEECDSAFSHTSGLKRHVKSFHREIRNYACDTCEYTSCRKDYMNKHLKALVHLKKEEIKCYEAFNSTESLNMPINVHSSIAKYICYICGEIYQDNIVLAKHMENAHDEVCAIKDASNSVTNY